MCKTIQYAEDKFAMVDDIDYEWLTSFSWSPDSDGYAKTNIKKEDGKYTTVRMHRLIMGRPEGLKVDHIDGNIRNNQRSNLRVADNRQNQWNRKPNKNSGSPYKGVILHDYYYRVYISIDGKRTLKGSFTNEVAAANCYNYHAKNLFGEFARLNEVEYMTENEWKSYAVKHSSYSEFRGVSFDKRRNKWMAYINVDKKRYNLGYFIKEEEAAIAYNNKAYELLGEKAMLNDIKEEVTI